MDIAKFQWHVKSKINKQNTGHNADVDAYTLDMLTEEAIIVFINEYANANKLPFETSALRANMLGNLLIKEEPVTLIKVSTTDNLYYFSTESLKEDYLQFARLHIIDGDCDLSVIFKQHDDLSHAFKDDFQKPSRKWCRTLGVLGATPEKKELGVFVYTDYDIELSSVKVYADYIRRPKTPFIGGYDTIEYVQCKTATPNNACAQYLSTTSPPVQIDLHDNYHFLLADIVTELFATSTSHQDKLALTERKRIKTYQ